MSEVKYLLRRGFPADLSVDRKQMLFPVLSPRRWGSSVEYDGFPEGKYVRVHYLTRVEEPRGFIPVGIYDPYSDWVGTFPLEEAYDIALAVEDLVDVETSIPLDLYGNIVLERYNG